MGILLQIFFANPKISLFQLINFPENVQIRKNRESFPPLLDSTSYKNGDIKMTQKTIVFHWMLQYILRLI